MNFNNVVSSNVINAINREQLWVYKKSPKTTNYYSFVYNKNSL